MQKTIGIMANRTKKNADSVGTRLITLIHEKGARALVQRDLAEAAGRPELGADLETLGGNVDILFVLGGDGTLLGAARRFAGHGVPMLGINIGHLGFLSEAGPEDLAMAVTRVLEGDFHLERRMMIRTRVYRSGVMVHESVGLNDAGVGKGSFARMIEVTVYVDEDEFDHFTGDGLIISTPTGSTAYSLSCGGPIVLPQINVMLVTPICAHQLVARPCVIGAEQKVRVRVFARHHDLGLTVDGQVGFPLQSNDEVIVERAPYETVLVRWQERAFFSTLREKLRDK